MYAYIIDHFQLDGSIGVFERELASAKRFGTKAEAIENLEGTGYKANRAVKRPTFFGLTRGGMHYRIEIVNLRDREQRDRYETVREMMASLA